MTPSNLLQATSMFYFTLYYAACDGSTPSPIDAPLAAVQTNRVLLNNSLSYLLNPTSGQCQNDPNLLATRSTLQNNFVANQTLIYNAVDCTQTTGKTIIDGINNQICGNMFNGFFTFYICFWAMSGGLFLMLCTSLVIYQYYDDGYWRVGAKDEDVAALDDEIEDKGVPGICYLLPHTQYSPPPTPSQNHFLNPNPILHQHQS